VFVRSGTNWTQQAYLKAHQVNASDRFGDSVAVAGDTVVVGASWEDSSTTGVNSTPNESAGLAGAAYVFAGVGPPPFISQITSVNPFQFQFDGGSRSAFEVEASTNLTHWMFIGQATNISGSLFQFSDSSVTNFPYRFYRLKVP
ncbi:MAG TPA: FG-GAP repeat protein, partial [Blastocatellia bacterium]|nr:FG-GAP repeat protein [Blastocatellia bacterium]